MANTNIQFYTDTRTVFETSNGNGKTAIGSANATVQGLEIEYNLLTTPEAFKISPLGVNYTSGVINDTTSLPRIAQVGSLLQSLETPPDATTLQVDKKILLTDGVSSGSIEISGVNTQITASGDLILNPVGSISTNGKTLDMSNGQIHKCPLIHSQNNNDIIVEGLGTGDVTLKTGGVNRLTISDTGFMTFQGGMNYDNATNTLTATNFNGIISNSTNSVNATNINVTLDDTNGNYYPTFVKTTGTGLKSLFIDDSSPAMTYNPSTGVMAFNAPPTSTSIASSANQLVNFNNFAADITYQPTLVSTGGGSPVYTTNRTGRFTIINNICIVQFELQLSTFGTLAAGDLSILLPVPVGSGTSGSFTIGLTNSLAPAGAVELTAAADPSSVSIALGIRRAITDVSVSPLTRADIASTYRVRIGGVYFV